MIPKNNVPGSVAERADDLVTQTVNAMIKKIMADGLGPGHPLPSQGKLCEELGVSRSVIREAMRVLQSRGFVDVSQGSRPRVTPASPNVAIDSLTTFVRRSDFSLLQLWEMRAPLEAEIAKLAARRITPDKLAELKASVVALRDAADLETQIDADIWFHRVLAEATGNPLFGIMLDVLADRLRASRRQTLARSGVSMALGYHQRILNAIEARDTEAAAREMTSHMEQTKQDLELP